MARKSRNHYEDALYHVIVRGNNRTSVFSNSEYKEKYQRMISRYKQRYLFKLSVYSPKSDLG